MNRGFPIPAHFVYMPDEPFGVAAKCLSPALGNIVTFLALS